MEKPHMALLVTCPITGYNFKLPGFKNKEQLFRISAPHPFMECDLGELNNIPFTTSHEEKCYLFVAYLWQTNSITNLVEFNSPLLPDKFTHMFLLQQLPRIKQFCNWLVMNKSSNAIPNFPGIRITKDTRQQDIAIWLDACYSVKEAETQPLLDGTAARLATRNYARDHGDEIIRGEESKTYQHNRLRKDYIAKSLAGHENEKVNLVTKVVFRPANYEIGMINAVKRFCLDFLQESTSEDFYEKKAIIKKLDVTIADKITMAEAIGIENEENTALKDELRSDYTIHHKGASFYNSILDQPSLEKIHSKLQTSKPQITVPESEPKREDYNNDFKFKLAYNLWKSYQN